VLDCLIHGLYVESGLRLSNLNKETTYLLTYLLANFPDGQAASCQTYIEDLVQAELVKLTHTFYPSLLNFYRGGG